MMAGTFGENGQLFFEIELIASHGESFTVEVLFDTGFTTGWLAINSQNLEALQLSLIAPQVEMQTARGDEFFDIHCVGINWIGFRKDNKIRLGLVEVISQIIC